MTLKLPRDLDRRLVALYRAWDHLERGRFRNAIIDFDLAESDEIPLLESRDAVLNELNALQRAAASVESQTLDLVRARLQASITYLHALRNDAVIPFREYVANTMGVEPSLIPETQILQSKSRLAALLRQYPGVRGGIPFSPEGFDLFRHEFQTQTGDNLKRQFEYFAEKWLPRLCRRIKAHLDPSSILVEFANEDAYWKNWISGNIAEGLPITVRINTHERHLWYQGAVEILVLHEYCGHAVQMALWQEDIRRDRISNFFGVLTVHFPDQFLLEGLAESVSYFLPDDRKRLERRSEIVRELHGHSLIVLNNVHILANNNGLRAARLYAKKHLPFVTDDTIERELRDRTSHPLFRSYQYVYAPAKEAFVTALRGLTPRQLWSLTGYLYQTPMTPSQVRKTLARYG
jgi:hypothetical protein